MKAASRSNTLHVGKLVLIYQKQWISEDSGAIFLSFEREKKTINPEFLKNILQKLR